MYELALINKEQEAEDIAMKRTVSTVIVVGALAGLVIVTAASKHGVRSVYALSGCTDATLSGNYGYLFTGFTGHVPLINNNGPTSVPFAAAGLARFDGAGNFSGTITASDNGVISPTSTFTTTYTVNSDCTGTIGTPNGGTDTFAIVIVSGGAEVLALETSPGGTETVDLKKQ